MKQMLCVQLVKLSSSHSRPKEHLHLRRIDYHTGMVPNVYHLIISTIVILNTSKSSSSPSLPSSSLAEWIPYFLFLTSHDLSPIESMGMGVPHPGASQGILFFGLEPTIAMERWMLLKKPDLAEGVGR